MANRLYGIFLTAFLCYFCIFTTSFSSQVSLKITNIPKELCLKILGYCFSQPTHPEEIIFQDKKVSIYSLVCKRWKDFCQDLLYKRVNFNSMVILFVQKRNWPLNSFIKIYTKRIEYLKKLKIAQNCENFLAWIKIENEEIEGAKNGKIEIDEIGTTKDSLFDWFIIHKFDYKDKPGGEPAVSLQAFHDYLINGGFVCSTLMNKLLYFLFYERDLLIKQGKAENSSLPQSLQKVLYDLHCKNKFFYFSILNIDSTDFLAELFSCASFCSGRWNASSPYEFASKQIFKDLEEFPIVIDYEHFVQKICSIPLYPPEHFSGSHYTKKVIEFFFKRLRNHFTQNNFEGALFLNYLLQYRLQFHEDIIVHNKEPLISWQLDTIKNLDSFIRGFIKEFEPELNRCSVFQKEKFYKLFNGNQKLESLHTNLRVGWYWKYCEREKSINNQFDWLFLSRISWIKKKTFAMLPLAMIGVTVFVCLFFIFNRNFLFSGLC